MLIYYNRCGIFNICFDAKEKVMMGIVIFNNCQIYGIEITSDIDVQKNKSICQLFNHGLWHAFAKIHRKVIHLAKILHLKAWVIIFGFRPRHLRYEHSIKKYFLNNALTLF